MPSRKNKTKASESEARSTSRMATRSANATAHPGNIVLESGRSRRNKEELRQEKEQKKARKEAEERKKIQADAWWEAGKAFVMQLEAKDAAAKAKAEKDLPRHRSPTQGTVVHSYQRVF
jgi:polyphosphate kinase 2 (PPK2 family)